MVYNLWHSSSPSGACFNMSNFKDKLLKITREPRKYFSYMLECGLFNNMDDESYIKLLWLIRMGYPIDLNHPKTFNEKLQWLKLHDHNPLYTIMADKYEAKQFVADRVGQDYVVPCYGVWDHFDDIDFENLPDEFVLKTTHDYAGYIIVDDRDVFDRKSAKKFLEKHLSKNHYFNTREWVYKNIKPRIIAEKLLKNDDGSELLDYKTTCFNGVPYHTYVRSLSKDKNLMLTYNDGTQPFPQSLKFSLSDLKLEYRIRKALNDLEFITFYDNNFNIIPCSNDEGPSTVHPIPKPANFDKMLEIAAVLSKNIPHVRVDFYEVNGKLYVGELTFYTSAGFANFYPDKYNYIFGDMIKLPE